MGELDEAPSSEPQHDTEEPKETDKMLNDKKDDGTNNTATPAADHTKQTGKSPTEENANAATNAPLSTTKSTGEAGDKKVEVNGEEIINIPENENAIDESLPSSGRKAIPQEGREVKPKKIPIGGIKMPGFFTKIKPRGEGDGADGELLERDGEENKTGTKDDEKTKKDEKKLNISDRIRNFFSRKKKTEETAGKPDAANTTGTSGENVEPPPKKGLLNAIKLPIANMIPKRKTDDDVEMGTGPGTKAGLASMETLDDSLKDQDTVDKVPPQKVNDEKLDKAARFGDEVKIEEKTPNEKEGAEEADNQRNNAYHTWLQRIRAYRCTLDDWLIVLGVLLFFILIGILIAVLSYETPAVAPLREGRYIDAVTSCGMVEGVKENNSFVFRGIPYAVPPVRENRWKPAKLIDNIDHCWNGTLKAHNETEVCSQILANNTKVGVEDCLTLDIVTPYVRYDNPLPVVVLIGAESLTGGSPSVLKPSPKLAHLKEVVFVRPNFRMGVLGFLALDVLSKSTYPPTSGNYALSDIIAALKWIKLNIVHFGGDANSVILVGHRAGGTLVSALVTSREVKDLYKRAWVTSSAAIFPGKPLSESERRNHEYLNMIQCNDTECLRNASVDEVLDATPDTWRHQSTDLPTVDENTTTRHEWLVLDGHILQEHPADVWKNEVAGANSYIKLVIGSTAHESHSEKLHSKYAEWNSENIKKHIEKSKLGSLNLKDDILQLYNATYQGLVAMTSDIRTICPLLTIARLQPSVPFYVVTQVANKTGLADSNVDIRAILGFDEESSLTSDEKKFISTMQYIFYKFVKDGEVSQFESRRRVITIGPDPVLMEDYPNCNFWISKDIVPRYSHID